MNLIPDERHGAVELGARLAIDGEDVRAFYRRAAFDGALSRRSAEEGFLEAGDVSKFTDGRFGRDAETWWSASRSPCV